MAELLATEKAAGLPEPLPSSCEPAVVEKLVTDGLDKCQPRPRSASCRQAWRPGTQLPSRWAAWVWRRVVPLGLRAAAGGTTDVLLGAAAQTLVEEFDPLPAPFLVVVRGTQIHGWAQINSWTETIAQIDEAEETGTNDRLVKGASS